MRNATHIARLLKACGITTEQLLSFVFKSKYLTARQREQLLAAGGMQ
ncbi:TPA: hypothetical protein ACOEHG_004883 [Enterobacter ludwigii]